ncbi:MAG: Trk system potassium transporter TrkA [Myxococcota bacterium]
MFVIVIGLGQVGRHIIRTLEWERHDVVAIDEDEDAIRFVEEHHDVMTLQGYGASQKVLMQARAHEADLVVAVTDHDEVNLVASLAARSLGAKRAVARVEGRQWGTDDDSTGVDYGFLGVDVVFNPKLLLARELAKIAQSHGATQVIDVADDRIEIVSVDLDDSFRRTNTSLSRMRLPEGVLVAAIVRDGELRVPGGADVLEPGDRIYLCGLPQQMLKAEDLFTKSRQAQRVCIVGGGVIGEHLAQTLVRDGTEVVLIEKNPARAHELSCRLSKVTVLGGDGTDLELLKDNYIENFDLFAAVSHEDEVNLMAALLAKRIGAKRTATVVHRADYVDIHEQLGINSVLSPRQLAADHVLRFVREKALKSVATLENGKAQVMEIRALEGARAIDIPVARMQVPKGALLCAVLKRDHAEIPSGQTIIEAGDTVIALATPRAYDKLEAMFKQRAF